MTFLFFFFHFSQSLVNLDIEGHLFFNFTITKLIIWSRRVFMPILEILLSKTKITFMRAGDLKDKSQITF
jgi:hypothetical protein